VSQDPLGKLLAWVAAERFEDLPPATIEASKTYLLNTAAAMLAGSSAPGAIEVVRQVREWGGKSESTVAVHGLKLPAPMAAFANGVMAHAMDFDDTQVGTGFHPNVSIVPALLAATEISADASGRDFLLAHVLALEVACRMTLAATNRARHPWLTTTLFGVFGAALAAGKIQRMSEALLRHAVGIAYSSAGGNRQGLLDGTLIQRVQPGLCAQAGVAAAAFARRGVTGAIDTLEGRYGLYPSYYGDDYDPQALTQGLGQDFRMLELALKPYPCCSYSQEPIEAALELAREHAIGADNFAGADVWVVSKHAAGLVDHPFQPRSCAQVDAQFSMQYVIAAAISRKSLGVADFQEAALRDPVVQELSTRVRVLVDPDREGCVEMRVKGGNAFSHRVPVARGHPKRPFSESDQLEKLRACGAQASAPRSPAQAEALARAIKELDQTERAADLAALLA
jgi:2-methylcitrate dehydratase PrpD